MGRGSVLAGVAIIVDSMFKNHIRFFFVLVKSLFAILSLSFFCRWAELTYCQIDVQVYRIPGSARPMPGQKFRIIKDTIGRRRPTGQLRCRSNEVLKL